MGRTLPDVIEGRLLAGELREAGAVAAGGHLTQGPLHLAGGHRLRLRTHQVSATDCACVIQYTPNLLSYTAHNAQTHEPNPA